MRTNSVKAHFGSRTVWLRTTCPLRKFHQYSWAGKEIKLENQMEERKQNERNKLIITSFKWYLNAFNRSASRRWEMTLLQFWHN